LHSGLGELRTELLKLRETVALVQSEKAELERSLSCSREQVTALTQERANFERQLAGLIDQLSQIERSLAWVLIQKARGIRIKLLRDGTSAARWWSRFSRFVRTALTQGMPIAIAKALDKIARRILQDRSQSQQPGPDCSTPVSSPTSSDCSTPVSSPTSPVVRFPELPWRFLAGDARPRMQRGGYFKILLVSHSACRTGAPLTLLRLLRALSELPDVECWVVLQQGGDLADSFARIAPTLEVDALLARGVPGDEVYRLVASAFREFSSWGLAICNTIVVNGFHTAFAEANVPVLSWIHELPTFMELLGGRDAIEAVKAASRRIIVVADFVRQALICRFQIDPDSIRTLYNGIEPRTLHLSRETTRLQVREELGLPADALIVLGCGTVDIRKGADLFVNGARRLLTDPLAGDVAARTWFIWVGPGADENLQRWLRHDAEIGGLESRIRFIGWREDMPRYYLAADVFVLTSREDPCPASNQEAMESGLAVVAFDGSGGGPEVLGDAGVVVPYIDVDAMAKAVRDLLANPARRSEMGRRGQDVIRRSFTWSRFMDEFLQILKADFQYLPTQRLKVSVVVPNYRHARFLEARLGSIFDQTYRPHEIIFLDDASPDDSVDVARRLATRAPVPMRIIVNAQNSGSTFRQWIKGLELATGDLVWIAESDDTAHPELLQRLVPEFEDPEVVLAYCQSALIGPEGEKLADTFLAHTDDISTTRWRSRYSVSGIEEAEVALSQKNTIPNASAVVFRRPQPLDFDGELQSLRFSGDLLFYAMRIRSGKIAYLPECLNFYRRHDHTVSHHSIRGDTYAEESLYVKARVFEMFPISANAINRSLGQTVREYNLLTERFNLERPTLTANPKVASSLNRIRAALVERRPPHSALKVLLVVNDLEAGPATLSAIHVANALAKEHEVFICNAQPWRSDPRMAERVDRTVMLLEGTLGQSPWSEGDHPAGDPGEHHDRRRVAVLKELIRFHRVDVIHSRSSTADRLVLDVNEELRLPWLAHVQDDYEAWPRRDSDDPGPGGLVRRIAGAVKAMFYEHESEWTVFERLSIPYPGRRIQLFPGFDPDLITRGEGTPDPRRGGDFRFLVIPPDSWTEPAWAEAIAAVRFLNRRLVDQPGNRRARLVRFADRSTLDRSPDRVGSEDCIEVLPGPPDPLAALRQCDVVLATQVSGPGELSYWAVAALGCSRPVIAAAHDAVAELLAGLDGEAGMLLPLRRRSGGDVDQLIAAMLAYLNAPELHAAHCRGARRIFEERFTVDRIAPTCAKAYLDACNAAAFHQGSGARRPAEREVLSLSCRRSA
jgi:glycosyltransferase involved in cell wall biosynthesis